MPDNTDAIAEIEATLNSGQTSTSVSDSSATVDLEFLQKRLAELKASHVGPSGETYMVRPKLMRINLS